MGWTNLQSNFVYIDPTQGLVLVYNGTPGSTTLCASIAGAAGTDSFGNKYLEGITTYAWIPSQSWYVATSMFEAPNATNPGLLVQVVGADAPYSAASINGGAWNGGTGNQQATLELYSGQATSTDTAAYVAVNSGDSSGTSGGTVEMVGSNIYCGGTFETDVPPNSYQLIDSGGVSWGPDSFGNPAAYCGTEAQTYEVGHYHEFATVDDVTSEQTVIKSNTLTAGTGYHISGYVIYTSTSASGTPEFGWGGSATAGTSVGWEGDFTATHINSGTLGSAILSAWTSTGTVGLYVYDVIVGITTAGTIGVTALAEGGSMDVTAYMRVERQ